MVNEPHKAPYAKASRMGLRKDNVDHFLRAPQQDLENPARNPERIEIEFEEHTDQRCGQPTVRLWKNTQINQRPVTGHLDCRLKPSIPSHAIVCSQFARPPGIHIGMTTDLKLQSGQLHTTTHLLDRSTGKAIMVSAVRRPVDSLVTEQCRPRLILRCCFSPEIFEPLKTRLFGFTSVGECMEEYFSQWADPELHAKSFHVSIPKRMLLTTNTFLGFHVALSGWSLPPAFWSLALYTSKKNHLPFQTFPNSPAPPPPDWPNRWPWSAGAGRLAAAVPRPKRTPISAVLRSPAKSE